MTDTCPAETETTEARAYETHLIETADAMTAVDDALVVIKALYAEARIDLDGLINLVGTAHFTAGKIIAESRARLNDALDD